MKITNDEILNMPASRGLDALIAEKVMGWKKIVNVARDYPTIYTNVIGEDHEGVMDRVPDYSTDIAAAWEVVKKLHKQFSCDVSIAIKEDHAHKSIYVCKIQYGKLSYDNPDLLLYTLAKTESLAICHAALLAVMEVE